MDRLAAIRIEHTFACECCGYEFARGDTPGWAPRNRVRKARRLEFAGVERHPSQLVEVIPGRMHVFCGPCTKRLTAINLYLERRSARG